MNADAGQITQIVMNLALNARDAMPEGGKLTIETHSMERVDDGIAHYGVRPAGTYVLLAVTDTGCGMDAELKAHIFEPFYTTKAAGRGTGLGLATVYGIVHQLGGWIDIYSEPNLGATFKIYFPEATDIPVVSPQVAGSAAPIRRAATILLVEDQAAIRVLAVKASTQAGHRVLAAATAVEALQLAREDKDTIDLLITDVVMPETEAGPELAARLARRGRYRGALYIRVHRSCINPQRSFRTGNIVSAKAVSARRVDCEDRRIASRRRLRSRPEAASPQAR